LGEGQPYRAATFVEEEGDVPRLIDLPACPSGVAPLARLVNVKVLNDDGTGSASAAIRGLEYLRKVNDGSLEIRVDGVNLSLGYPFDPQSYGCGYSPLCQEVTRAVEFRADCGDFVPVIGASQDDAGQWSTSSSPHRLFDHGSRQRRGRHLGGLRSQECTRIDTESPIFLQRDLQPTGA